MRCRFLVALIFLTSLLAAQSAPERPAYVFLSYINVGDAEQRINDYAADGFRLVGFQFSLSGALVIALQDIAPFGEARYEYRFVGGNFQRFVNDKHPLQQQLTALGSEGWHVVGSSLLNMEPDAWNSVTNDSAFAMERLRGDTTPVEYRLERAMLASNALKDVQRDRREGFSLLMLYAYPGQRISLLERSDDPEKPFVPATDGAQSVEIVNFTPKHMREKLDDAVKRGLHLLALSSVPGAFSAAFVPEPSLAPPVYVFGELKFRADSENRLAGEQWATVERQLNEASAKGYSISVRPMFLNGSTIHYLIPMEANAVKLQYRILSADALPDLSTEVNEAALDGWTVVPGLLYGGRIVFLEKYEPQSEPGEAQP